MESCDVLIVGGGPAGSTCARRLSAAGLDVMVLDKRPFPRDKVCAGWVTPEVIEELEIDCQDYAQGRVFQAFAGFRTGMIGGRQVTTDYDHPVSYGIRRCEFDHYLLERAGARLRLGEPLKRLQHEGGRWIVNEEISTALLIGAGGHFCPVARELGAKRGKDEHVIAAQEIEFELTPQQMEQTSVDSSRPELFFCQDLKGYGWAVRKGNFLNVGLGREDNHRLSQHLAEFRALLIEQGKVPADMPEKFHGHAYLLSSQRQPRPLVADQALLIGDASGLAYPQSGEGIRPAIESGLLAAETVLHAGGRYQAERLQPYADKIIARFGERQADDEDAAWLPQGLRLFAARKLMGSGWFARHVLIDRWFLHVNKPGIQSVLQG